MWEKCYLNVVSTVDVSGCTVLERTLRHAYLRRAENRRIRLFFPPVPAVRSKQEQDEEVKWEQQVVYLNSVSLKHGHQSDGANDPGVGRVQIDAAVED